MHRLRNLSTLFIGALNVSSSGVASVMISLDGTVVTGRTDPPYRFELSAPGLPVRVKATVTDTHGNSASAQAIVQGPSTSCPCPEIYAPVCGVDGVCQASPVPGQP